MYDQPPLEPAAPTRYVPPPRTGVKHAVRRLVMTAFGLLAAPFTLFYRLTGRHASTFASIMQVGCLVPALPGLFFRQALLRSMATRCGDSVGVHLGTTFSSPDVQIGDHVYVGLFCSIGRAHIDDWVLIGSHVNVLSGKHQHGYDRLDIPIALQPGRKECVSIGYGTWVGNGAIIMADVGCECIIAAGAVVVDPIPNWSIAVGSPARVVGDRRALARQSATQAAPPPVRPAERTQDHSAQPATALR